MNTKITDSFNKNLVKVLGIAGYILLTFFAVMFALIACVTFCSMFSDNFVAGLIGTIAASALARITWSIRKDVL